MSTQVNIDPKLVKKLRDEIDAPMMECKNALVAAGADYNKGYKPEETLVMGWLSHGFLLRDPWDPCSEQVRR